MSCLFTAGQKQQQNASETELRDFVNSTRLYHCPLLSSCLSFVAPPRLAQIVMESDTRSWIYRYDGLNATEKTVKLTGPETHLALSEGFLEAPLRRTKLTAEQILDALQVLYNISEILQGKDSKSRVRPPYEWSSFQYSRYRMDA